jgi:hypothetical protein
MCNSAGRWPFVYCGINCRSTGRSCKPGDYNGDGFSDILLEDNTGTLKAWFMQGATVAKT